MFNHGKILEEFRGVSQQGCLEKSWEELVKNILQKCQLQFREYFWNLERNLGKNLSKDSRRSPSIIPRFSIN